MRSALPSSRSAPRRRLRLVYLGLAAVLAVPATGQESDSDWVDIRQIPEDERNRMCRVCGGRYVDPLADADRSIPPEDSDLSADAGSVELAGDTARFSGGVSLRQGYRQLRGESATIDRLGQTIVVEGDIEVREPGLLLRGNRAVLRQQTNEAEVDQSRFVLHEQHLRGSAAGLRRDSGGVVHIDQGTLSFCPPDNDDWLLQADSMALDIDAGVGTARGAQFDLGGVPVFYSPWMRFPLDDRRRTGFLWPDIGSDTRGGFDIAIPFYLNLAPNYDAQYTPRYLSDRGFNHEIQLRYLDRTWGFWSLGGAFLPDDDRYRSEVPDARDHDRWLTNVQHQNLFEGRWRSRVDYTRVSDVDYFRDLDAASLDARRQANLLQLGTLDYLGDRWLVNLQLQQFQPLADDIREDYRKLPQLTARYRGEGTPFKLQPVAEAQYSYFDSNAVRVTGQRIYAEAGLTYPMLWASGFLTSTAKYRALQYDLSDSLVPREEEKPSAGTAVFNIDGGLYFERPTRMAGRGLLQTLEPRVYYLYSEFEDQRDQPDFDTAELTFNYNQLFRDTRFSGRDRLDDANQLALGVTTRLISDEDGREQFMATIGQIFYFRDRKVRLQPSAEPLDDSGSEIAGELSFLPTERWNLRGQLVWDPFSGKVNSSNFFTSYTRDRGDIYNFGYTYRRPVSLIGEQPNTEQVHVSAWVPVRDKWNLFASWNYSLEAQESVEDMVGLEYDSCCWKFRLLYLRYFDNVTGGNPDFNNPDLEREHATQIQIILKGLGGFGDRVDSLLEDMIQGYRERDD
jgi:LPS-assembly protein